MSKTALVSMMVDVDVAFQVRSHIMTERCVCHRGQLTDPFLGLSLNDGFY
jgi:hypothetical protein